MIGPVPTYGILYSVGILVHFLVSRSIAKRCGLERRVWIIASACYLVGMTFGAKALYDIRYSQLNLYALLKAEHYLGGGLWGGLLAYLALAVPLMILVTKRRGGALDLVALSIPIPWAFAKLGCLFNGCCYGQPCFLPWAITFPEGARGAPAGVLLHPTQIYEIVIMAGLLVIFQILRSDRWHGTMLLWFLAIYGFGRAVTDIFRGDSDQYACNGVVTFTQLVCLVAAIGSVVVLLFRMSGRGYTSGASGS